MTKAEMLDKVSEKTGFKKNDVENTVDAMLGIIGDALAAGEKVQISGFGAFTISNRKQWTGKNMRTGAPMVIPAVKVAKFRAGTGLKEKLGLAAESGRPKGA